LPKHVERLYDYAQMKIERRKEEISSCFSNIARTAASLIRKGYETDTNGQPSNLKASMWTTWLNVEGMSN
jgi:hypothetical protein